MRRPASALVALLIMTGVALMLGFYTSFALGGVCGVLIGLGIAALRRSPSPAADPTLTARLMAALVDMGDALQETSPRALQERGGWNQALFDDVLTHVERQAPRFQTALTTYLTQPSSLDPDCVTALLAVDRLSAAYTYWTRLFPPRQPNESMFVLSLLHDLSEKVELAISLLGTSSS